MMNLIDTSPRPLAPVQPTEAAPSEAIATQASATGDSVAAGRFGATALAYFPSGRGVNAAVDLVAAPREAETDSALAARFGSQLALVRAVLPAALQAQFVAQLTAAYGAASAGEPVAPERGTTLRESDLAKLLSAGSDTYDDPATIALVSRLSHDVARYGSAAVAQALQLAHDRTAFPPYGASPDTPPDERVVRRDADERHKRRQQQPERPAHDERSDDTVPGPSGATYTIDDVVRFGDRTIATHQMLPPALNIERTSP